MVIWMRKYPGTAVAFMVTMEDDLYLIYWKK
jgi:hypothetical protein